MQIKNEIPAVTPMRVQLEGFSMGCCQNFLSQVRKLTDSLNGSDCEYALLRAPSVCASLSWDSLGDRRIC
jgi:hypothetical protein